VAVSVACSEIRERLRDVVPVAPAPEVLAAVDARPHRCLARIGRVLGRRRLRSDRLQRPVTGATPTWLLGKFERNACVRERSELLANLSTGDVDRARRPRREFPITGHDPTPLRVGEFADRVVCLDVALGSGGWVVSAHPEVSGECPTHGVDQEAIGRSVSRSVGGIDVVADVAPVPLRHRGTRTRRRRRGC